jgi:ribosomal protein L19
MDSVKSVRHRITAIPNFSLGIQTVHVKIKEGNREVFRVQGTVLYMHNNGTIHFYVRRVASNGVVLNAPSCCASPRWQSWC